MPGATNLPHLNRDLFLDAPAKSNTVVIASVLTAAVIALTVGVWAIWFRSTDDPGVVTIAQQTAPTPQLPAGSTTPPAGTNTLARAIDVQPIFNKKVYLNSQLALTKFEDEHLWGTNPTDALMKAFPNLEAGWVLADMQKWWKNNRPSFVVEFGGLAQETEVKITVQCPNESAKKYLNSGIVTKQEWMTVGGNSNSQLPIALKWNLETVREIERAEDVTFEVEVQYRDNSIDKFQHTVSVHPANIVEHGYPNTLGFAGLVDEDHRYVREILDAINQGPLCKRTASITSGGGGPEADLIAIFLVWDHLQRRGLRYLSLPGNADIGAQACRSVHESLSAKNANCVDGTVLLSSFMEKMGLHSALVLVPGHAFLAFDSTLMGDIICIETTMLGNTAPKPGEPAFKVAEDLWTDLSAKYQTLQKFEAQLDPKQKSAFRGFLLAIHAGESEFGEQQQATQNGDPKKNLPSWSDAVAQYTADPANEQILEMLTYGYMRVIPIGQARAAKVTSIGTDPDVLKKFPLPPAQP